MHPSGKTAASLTALNLIQLLAGCTLLLSVNVLDFVPAAFAPGKQCFLHCLQPEADCCADR
jgi:hypothetical protein